MSGKAVRLQPGEKIEKVPMADGRTRYRIVVDLGPDPATGKRRQARRTFDTVEEAREAKARLTLERVEGKVTARSGVTVEGWAATWLDRRRSLQPTTVENYRAALAVVIAAHGATRLQDLTRGDVEALVTARLGVVSPRSVRLMLVVLGAMLKAAMVEGLVSRNVAAGIDLPDHKPVKVEPWTEEEARAFLSHVEGDRLAACYRLSLYGLRRGEVAGLRWSSILWEESAVVVADTRVLVNGAVHDRDVPKSGKERVVPVGAEVIADLAALQIRQAAEAAEVGDGYNPAGLVLVHEDGTAVRPDAYGRAFQGHARAAGLRAIKLHTLRATAASLMIRNGAALSTVAEVLGHDVQVLIEHYAHVYRAEKVAAAEGLSRTYMGSVGALA